jgi:hypothetical protein
VLRRVRLVCGATSSCGLSLAYKALTTRESEPDGAYDNKRLHEGIPPFKPVEMTIPEGAPNGQITDISVGGAAIMSHGPLQIGLGEPVELRVENFEKVLGHVVRAKSGNDFAIAFGLNEIEAREIFDQITDDET